MCTWSKEREDLKMFVQNQTAVNRCCEESGLLMLNQKLGVGKEQYMCAYI